MAVSTKTMAVATKTLHYQKTELSQKTQRKYMLPTQTIGVGSLEYWEGQGLEYWGVGGGGGKFPAGT